ncbi:MAG: N-6 DNA methylase, partial [Oscillochloris sp.]|nr:N-6 DNA methylase [Oscillochloris sp.]
MSTSQLPLALARRHYNRQLFADRYLDEILPRRGAWLDLVDAAAPVLRRVREIFAAFSPSANEAQTEHDLVRPVLAALGHAFEVQVGMHTPAGTKKPDYVLYRDQAALLANKNRVLGEADFASALAVGDAKFWERKLDVSAKGELDEVSRVPSRQIAFYMLHSGVAWGILTNGRRWRLYHKDTAHKEEIFYEVDLKDLAEANDPAAFLSFYAFFRHAAFVPGLGDGLTLDALLRESVDYARGISDSLKLQVFDALRHIAQGFLDYPRNGLQTTPETLHAIYGNSLIVLYRLLFVLYAEARELLPLRESVDYREEYSLYATVREAARRIDSGMTLLVDTGRTWAKLRDLFEIINAGSPPLKVATFNGGLFDPQRHAFLDRATVGDAQLQLALDKLARVEREFIDYCDLAERHLGTIYEGLLEYHLVPIERGADGFSVDLVNDKGERHRTGSYYTPDFVVQYIVEQTLRPILDAAVAGKLGAAERVAAVLHVNCIDPAMGSGHFPVAAMEFIARYLVELGVAPADDAPPRAHAGERGVEGDGLPAGEDSDLAYWKRRVAQSCIYGLDLNPLAVDLAKLSLWLATAAKGRPLSFLDHHLRCGNALVGARASALDAVMVAPKKLKRSKKEAVAAEMGQLSLLDDAAFAGAMISAVGSMWLIEGSAGRTVGDVKEQERIYEQVRAGLTEHFAVHADLVTAAGFGAAPEPSMWRALADYATRRDAGAFATPAFERPLEQLRALREAQRFFHWDLEFPEIFYDGYGRSLGEQAGFDALLGNPPYVRQEQLGSLKPYFQAAFPETYSGTADLFIYFFQQGLKLLRQGGRMSYIVTNKWLRAGYGEGLRGYFAQNAHIEQLIDFGHAPIFADADVFPCIIVLEKPADGAVLAEQQVRVTAFPREALKLVRLDSYVARYSHPVPQARFGRSPWSLEDVEIDDLMAKIRRAGLPLAEFAGVKPYRGVLTGFNEAFLIDTLTKERLIREDPRSAEIIKPYLRGQDIKRWVPEWADMWLIVLKSSGDQTWPWSSLVEDIAEVSFQQNYPALYSFMKPLEDRLRKRQDKGRYWWELRSCAYYDVFDRSKLLYQELQFHAVYSLDSTGYFLNNKVFLLPTADLWLLAVLNSPLMWWHNWRFLPHMKDEALTPAGFLIEQLPIARPSDEARAEAESAVARLIAITQANQEARRDTLDWLRSEFALDQAGQRLTDFASLSTDDFITE